ncbi:MAG: hypothetical protein SFU27_04185 [Thermonemataceae bacterium]|nr:hypothetical protein [Thermonemataceae bacterium]
MAHDQIQSTEKSFAKLDPVTEKKKVNITLHIGGYTVHLTGVLQVHILQGTVTFDGTLAISGNGISISLPIHYYGDGNDRVIINASMSEMEIAETLAYHYLAELGLL